MAINRHSAQGPAAGFQYQFGRAFYWLACKQAGASVGIETADDVEIRNADGESTLEQDKHAIDEKAQPFSDRSKGLWNTLSIWIDALHSGERSVESTAFLFVTNRIVPNCIARRIASAKSPAEIDACIANLQTAGKDPPEHIAKIVSHVLDPRLVGSLREVIEKTELEDASNGTASAELRGKAIAYLQLPTWCSNASESIANELSGWLMTAVISAWEKRRPAWVQRDHFVNELYAIVARRKREAIRERAAFLIPVTDDKVGREMGSPFVKQLHFISDDDTVVDTAIREFIRCNIEKARLSKEGNITDDDWDAFQDTLVSRWRKIRSRVLRMKNESAEPDIGFEIFSETTEDHKEKLAGSDTEQVYLTSGTYHRLANMLKVGWHPRYEALMREILETNDRHTL